MAIIESVTLMSKIMGGGQILGGLLKAKGDRDRRRAARARNEIRRIQNMQARRTFINNFLTAQGQALASGATSGIDVMSSGTQGMMASQRTQATTGLVEQNEMSRLGELSNEREQSAARYGAVAELTQDAFGAFEVLNKAF
jgi:hypothetical protein